MSSLIAYDLGLLLVRLSGFYLALGHGLGKAIALASGEGGGLIAAVEALKFPMPLVFAWAAALAELVGGLCVGVEPTSMLSSPWGCDPHHRKSSSSGGTRSWP